MFLPLQLDSVGLVWTLNLATVPFKIILSTASLLVRCVMIILSLRAQLWKWLVELSLLFVIDSRFVVGGFTDSFTETGLHLVRLVPRIFLLFITFR